MTELDGRTIAAVDLGSNSFHLVVAQLRNDARDFVVIDRLKQPVRLRMGLDTTGRLSPEAQARALDCLSLFGERVAGIPRADVRAVGTNTLRSARNSLPFLVRARRALGHKIEVISGLDEARLIYQGVARDLAGDGRRLVVDIGGGSTELIVGDGSTPSALDSREMGCVSWTLRYFPDGQLTRKGFERAVLAARLKLETSQSRMRALGWTSAVGASGTIKAVDKVVHAMLGQAHITPWACQGRRCRPCLSHGVRTAPARTHRGSASRICGRIGRAVCRRREPGNRADDGGPGGAARRSFARSTRTAPPRRHSG